MRQPYLIDRLVQPAEFQWGDTDRFPEYSDKMTWIRETGPVGDLFYLERRTCDQELFPPFRCGMKSDIHKSNSSDTGETDGTDTGELHILSCSLVSTLSGRL